MQAGREAGKVWKDYKGMLVHVIECVSEGVDRTLRSKSAAGVGFPASGQVATGPGEGKEGPSLKG